MTGSFTNPGDGSLIVQFTYQADFDKIEETINKAGEHMYERFPIMDDTDPVLPIIIPWDTLTNSQKLDVVDTYLRVTIMEEARAQLRLDAISAAADAADEDDSIDIGV